MSNLISQLNGKYADLLDTKSDLFNGIVDSVDNVFCIVKNNGCILFGNCQLANLLHVPVEDLINKNIQDLFLSEDSWDEVAQSLSLLAENKGDYRLLRKKLLPLKELYKDNFNKVFEWSIYPFCKQLDSKEDVYLCVGNDVSEITFTNLLVEQQSKALYEKSKEIISILNHIKQGIFTFGADLKIHNEYSKYLEEIFHTRKIEGENVINLLFSQANLSQDRIAQTQSAILNSLGSDLLTYDLNESVLPREIIIDRHGANQFIEIEWSTICSEGNVQKIMVIIRDVTEYKKLQSVADQEKETLDIISQIFSKGIPKFLRFAKDAFKMLDECFSIAAYPLKNYEQEKVILSRNLHTIKGNSRVLNYTLISSQAHLVENFFFEGINQDYKVFQKEAIEQLFSLRKIIAKYQEILEEKASVGNEEVKKEKYVLDKCLTILNNMTQEKHVSHELSEIIQYLSTLDKFTLPEMLLDMDSLVKETASYLNKPIPKVELVSGHEILIDNSYRELLNNVLCHIFNNAIDHGLESAEERQHLNKDVQGKISFKVFEENERLKIECWDDGSGLNLTKLRERGQSLGSLSPKASDLEVANLIFSAGFSTKLKASEVSGRGVGLFAVKDFVEHKGGILHIKLSDESVRPNFKRMKLVIDLPLKKNLPGKS